MHPKKTPVCKQIINFDQPGQAASQLERTVKKLLGLRRRLPSFEHVSQVPTPSIAGAKDIIELARQLLFPGFFSPRPVTDLNIDYHTGQILYVFYEKLSREIAISIRHDCRRYDYDCTDCQDRGRVIAMEVAGLMPQMREILATDVVAAREGDPAAGDHFDQIIFCYPGLYAVLVQRLAHELYRREVPFLPRILTEYAHAKTGIDIHPGAEIGPSFFIDHGTGVVIGETTTIGAGVRLYQGVTLGALSLPRDASTRLQGKKRHPTLEDGVIVYSGATILGGETVIGAGSVIGGNVWLTESVPPNTKVLIKNPELVVINGSAPGTTAAETKDGPAVWEVSAPRRPGRPRKTEGAETTPRRPGRPKKNAGADSSPRRPGRPKKSEGAESSPRRPGQPKKTEGATGSARRPGRPRKSEGAESSPRRPGRPKKTEGATSPARRPGRPKKTREAASSPRRPGRPRKVQSAES